MAANAFVLTTVGKAMLVDRVRQSPATYTAGPRYLAVGTGATGASRTAGVGDTALTTEVETRVAGTESTVTTSTTGDTYQNSATMTVTGNRALDEWGLFDALTSGNMFVSGTQGVMNLQTNDSVQFIEKVQQT